jgi:hypothetical protein
MTKKKVMMGREEGTLLVLSKGMTERRKQMRWRVDNEREEERKDGWVRGVTILLVQRRKKGERGRATSTAPLSSVVYPYP